jgi:NTP pyrophosphatase (non-canonical NTP hydrolase)
MNLIVKDPDDPFTHLADTELRIDGMTLDEYQELAMEIAIYPPEANIIYPAFGLASEAGEVMGKLAKRFRDAEGDLTDPVFLDAIALELGDVLWNVAALANDLGWNLEDIADRNLSKLASRAARGVLGGSGDDR